jgi:hypothetical protein
MTRFRVTGPNGESFIVNAPEGATKEQAIAIARQHIASKPKGLLRSVDDFIRGAADAATLGYADEIAAKMESLTGIGGTKGNYSANVTRERAKDANGGGARMAGQVAGSLLLPTSKLTAAKGLGGLAATMAEGAAYGGAYATGSGQGNLQQRIKAAPKGAALGAAGGAAGRAVGGAVGRIVGGKIVSPAVRTLANEGVVMTPGQRGGAIAKGVEEGLLGSLPLVKAVPQAAKRRGMEQLNIAAYNRVLQPLGERLPMNAKPGRDAVAALGDRAYAAYDDASSNLTLGMDKAIGSAAKRISNSAPRTVGNNANQLRSIIADTLAKVHNGATGTGVRDILSDLRAEASSFSTSPVANERRLGDQLWGLHDELEAGIVRQNGPDVLAPFKAARKSVSLFKRVEAAAAKTKDGIFTPQQLRTAVTKRGYGTTTANVATGKAPMQDLADAASQVLPATIPDSGSPVRLASLFAAGGGLGFLNPHAAAAAGAPLAAYAPGVDRALQNLALNRPNLLHSVGNWINDLGPYLGTAGAITAADQGR